MAPEDYAANWFIDPPTAAGYVHAFLRPYRAVVFGLLSDEGKPRPLWDPGFIVYPFLDAAPVDGLRCPGAISIYKRKQGFSFVFFPATPKRDLTESEVDHLSAHVEFRDGTIEVAELHAKVRIRGRTGPTRNLPLTQRKDETSPFGFVHVDANHFAFEYWCRDVRILDPAGSVESTAKWDWADSRLAHRLRTSIERSRPITLACPAPTPDGLVPVGVPLVVRVGLITDEGRKSKGGTAAALSDPHATGLGTKRMRSHRYADIRGIDPSWPGGVSLFVESGLMKLNPPNEYGLPDVRGTAFEQFVQHP